MYVSLQWLINVKFIFFLIFHTIVLCAFKKHYLHCEFMFHFLLQFVLASFKGLFFLSSKNELAVIFHMVQ